METNLLLGRVFGHHVAEVFLGQVALLLAQRLLVAGRHGLRVEAFQFRRIQTELHATAAYIHEIVTIRLINVAPPNTHT